MQNLLNEAGFGRVIIVGKIDINQNLVGTLVEFWRPETHTYHFPHGETNNNFRRFGFMARTQD